MRAHQLTLGFLAAGALAIGASFAAPARPAPSTQRAAAPGPDGGVAPDAPAAASETVRVEIQTSPRVRARVTWGRKRLGVIAPGGLLVVRPRDSEPMDLVIRAPGYLPVHTRAYTFSDTRLTVKLTPVDQKHTLFGYKEELPPDGGVAPEVAPATR